MAPAFRFESFETSAPDRAGSVVPADQVEPRLVESYETGYKAGWDDAAAAQSDDAARLGLDLAASLRAIALTADEARAHMLASVQPLLNDMVTKMLPTLSADTLGHQVAEIIKPMVDEAVDASVQLVVNPGDREQILRVIEHHAQIKAEVVPDDGVGNGQVFVRVGSTEKSLDQNEVFKAIQTAIRAFYGEDGSNDEVGHDR